MLEMGPSFLCPIVIVWWGNIFWVGTNAASPRGSPSEESISHISLGPAHAEGKVVPQAAGQAKDRMLHF